MPNTHSSRHHLGLSPLRLLKPELSLVPTVDAVSLVPTVDAGIRRWQPPPDVSLLWSTLTHQ
jgi:hypothetical protein